MAGEEIQSAEVAVDTLLGLLSAHDAGSAAAPAATSLALDRVRMSPSSESRMRQIRKSGSMQRAVETGHDLRY